MSIFADIKVSIATIAIGFASSISQLINFIPDNIGKLTAFLSAVAVLYVIINNKKSSIIKDQEIEINKLIIAEKVFRANEMREGK